MLVDFLLPKVRLLRIYIHHKESRIQNPDPANLKCFGSGYELEV